MKNTVILFGKTSVLFIIFCILITVIISCDDKLKNDDNGFVFDEKTFMSHWDAWNMQNIKNYSFSLEQSYSFWFNSRGVPDWNTYKFKIIVKNGLMDSFEYNVYDYDDNHVEGNFDPPFTSITDMYQKIYDWAQQEKQNWKNSVYDGMFLSTEYNMEYNSELHYIAFFGIADVWHPNFFGSPHSPFRVLDFKILD